MNSHVNQSWTVEASLKSLHMEGSQYETRDAALRVKTKSFGLNVSAVLTPNT